jgi:hypothetical protein
MKRLTQPVAVAACLAAIPEQIVDSLDRDRTVRSASFHDRTADGKGVFTGD